MHARRKSRQKQHGEGECDRLFNQAQRAETATGLPDDLVALYEKVRTSSSGVGAAALHQGRCEGCHLQLNTTDINRIREADEDEVLRCEECRRILVRTATSGL